MGLTWSVAKSRKGPARTTLATALIGAVIGAIAANAAYREVQNQLEASIQQYLHEPLALVGSIRNIIEENARAT